jgi:hypothetical protein
MSMQFEDFKYDGPAILAQEGGNAAKPSVSGIANVAGKIGRTYIANPGSAPTHGMIDAVSIDGVFISGDPVPAGFIRASVSGIRIGDEYKLSLTGDGGFPAPLLCTVERTKDERIVKVIHAGYRHG